ncbi:hypothetical protein F5Y19DRAFT_481002 [Xylariaceae sp. FL1651]|nr:hypothetical protein F5Y19DRAFT_481002 [Xylariaceae sp. FL1651]
MEAVRPSRRESQAVLLQDFVPEDIPESIMNDTNNDLPPKRLIIAVDFGTTYSCVSYVALEEGEAPEYLELDRIECIQNFPDDCNTSSNPMEPMRRQVPTEVMYPQSRSFRREEDLEQPANGEGENDDEAEASINQDISFMEIERDDEEIDLDELFSQNLNRFRWGYSVHDIWALPSTHRNPNNKPLSRFKLLLDNSSKTQTVRDDLLGTLDSLKRRRIINKPLQVIADFLTCLLRHTRSELLEKGYDDSWKTEMVLCVPAIWSQKACRDMQTAMAIGMDKAKFGGADVQNNSIENLFIVSEPEAAAAYALARDHSIQPGDTFVLLDAGGGTVDANTYTISLTTPLRLRTEVVEPGGGLFGSSYLNERFRKLLKELLRDEKYLETGVETIDGIIESIIIGKFEYSTKRSFDCFLHKTGAKRFPISGLRDNPAKFLRDGCLHVPVSKITPMFNELLQGIASIMEDQINKALQKGCRVEKVILIGGFAASPSLHKYLKQRLGSFSRSHNCSITLCRPENTSTAVASGGVLRAFNKKQGPERRARSSYGILRTEPFYRGRDEPRNRPEYEGLNPFWDPDDGMPYIKDTVDWVLKLGDLVGPAWYCRPFACSHTIRAWPPRPLLCKEVLYVSDRSTRSHYKLNHPNNQGAEKIGEIVADFTFLRDRGLIHPIDPVTDEKTGKTVGKRHYKVNYTMVIRVVDRDLQCYAIYNGVPIQKCKINIASAFKPGVK